MKQWEREVREAQGRIDELVEKLESARETLKELKREHASAVAELADIIHDGQSGQERIDYSTGEVE